jgi:hypothetical protein
MIRGSPGRLRIDPAEIERTKIKLVDEHVNHTNWVVPIDPIIQAFGKQRRLPAIRPSTKRFIATLPRKSRQNYIMPSVFTQPGPNAEPGASRIADCMNARGAADGVSRLVSVDAAARPHVHGPGTPLLSQGRARWPSRSSRLGRSGRSGE